MKLVKIYQKQAVYLDNDKIIVETIPTDTIRILNYYKKITINDI